MCLGCVGHNPECVCFLASLCVFRFFYVLCMWFYRTGSKGQIKGQHTLSLETQQRRTLIFLFVSLSHFKPQIYSLTKRQHISVQQLFSGSVPLFSGLAVWTVQKPGGGFGFRQSLSPQHLRKQSSRQKPSGLFQLFSPSFDYFINFSFFVPGLLRPL